VSEEVGMVRRKEKSVKPGGGRAPGSEPRVALERARFKSLLLQNPNYFGNLDLSPFKPVRSSQAIPATKK
jgi:hypothetical protein